VLGDRATAAHKKEPLESLPAAMIKKSTANGARVSNNVFGYLSVGTFMATWKLTNPANAGVVAVRFAERQ
jgi:hypothetical protein